MRIPWSGGRGQALSTQADNDTHSGSSIVRLGNIEELVEGQYTQASDGGIYYGLY